jgi:thiamine biosynthesis lipoprotein
MAIVSQSQRAPTPAPTASGPDLPLRRRAFQSLGTTCELQYAAPGGDAQAAEFERTAIAWVEGFEAKYSRFRPTSLLSRINAAAGASWVEIDPEMEQMLKLCDTLVFMTGGILDPTALPLIRLWNWKEPRPAVPPPAQVAEARSRVGWAKVQRSPGKVFLPEPGMALDFGGFGKEYAVDLVAQIALNCGIPSVLVDFGHDIRVQGAPPGRPAWHIGLEDPAKPGEPWGSVAVGGSLGIASSGDYLRNFVIEGRRYGHIIDPRTGWPAAAGCTQATVVAASCLQAGVLSTTAVVLGLAKGIDFIQACPGAEGMLLGEKVRAQTRGFFRYVVSG